MWLQVSDKQINLIPAPAMCKLLSQGNSEVIGEAQ
jgi:hypothetical protein